MNRIILALAFAASLSACVKLQMPDDLISDTVDAIKGSDDDAPADSGTAGTSTFSHSVVGAADTPESDLRAACLAELESRTAELLGGPDVTFSVISESVSFTRDKAIATCTVSVQ